MQCFVQSPENDFEDLEDAEAAEAAALAMMTRQDIGRSESESGLETWIKHDRLVQHAVPVCFLRHFSSAFDS